MHLLGRRQRQDRSGGRESTMPLIPNHKRSQLDLMPITTTSESCLSPQRCSSFSGRFRIARSRSNQTSSRSSSQENSSSSRTSSQSRENHKQETSNVSKVPETLPVPSHVVDPELTFVAASELQENPFRDRELPYNVQVLSPSRLPNLENQQEDDDDDVSEISLEGFSQTHGHVPQSKESHLEDRCLLYLPSPSTVEIDSAAASVGEGNKNTGKTSEQHLLTLGPDDSTREGEEEELLFRSDVVNNDNGSDVKCREVTHTSSTQLNWTMQCFEDSTEVQLFQMMDQSGEWSSGFSF